MSSGIEPLIVGFMALIGIIAGTFIGWLIGYAFNSPYTPFLMLFLGFLFAAIITSVSINALGD